MDPRSVIVDFGSHGRIRVDAEALSNWFPTFSWPSTSLIDGSSLISKLHNRLHSRFNISKFTIRESLRQLFDQLRFHPFAVPGETRTRIARGLAKQLEFDVDANGNWTSNKGYHHSRHCFIVLAYLANEHESILLAGALLEFWYAYKQDIMMGDQIYLTTGWYPAVRKVEELGSDGMVHGPAHMGLEAFALLPHGGWHRGRTPHRMAGLPWPDNRALSAPVIRRRHSPDMRIGLPGFPSSAWTSPMISPVEFPRANYFDEINVLQYQQQEVNMKLDNIDRKLDYLAGY